MKTWVALVEGFVVDGFQAEDELVNNLSDGREYVDITNVTPKPVIGWYRTDKGEWINTLPLLSTNKHSIPSDGVTIATVTFSQKGPNAPSTVVFNVNGVDVSETLSSNGTATCEVVSTNPGDVIVVSANGASVTITVEG